MQISRCALLSRVQLSSAGDVPAAIWGCAALQVLTLDQIRPSAAALQQVTRLRALQGLRLCHGHLQDALPSLAVPSSMTSLALDQSGLRDLPHLGWLSQLRDLNLQHNR